MKQKLMDSDIRFRKIIENNYSGITLLNTDLEIIYRSPSAERITGWTTEKRALKPSIAIVHPDDQPGVTAVLDKVVAVAGLSLTCTFRFMHHSGHFIWLENTYTNMLAEPDIQAIVCNFRDVTEQRETELELKKQTNQISELLETMTDSFIALDENLCYTHANKQVTKLLGRTAESMIGQHIWSLYPDAVGSATYEAILTAFTEKRYVCNEDFYAPLQLWQENRVYPSAGGVSVFIRDITKQKKEEHHLKLLESVITNTTDAVLITEAEPFDEPGPRILYVNEAFTKMTGYTPEEIVGQSPRILQGPKTDKRELRRLGKSLREWKPCEVTLLNYKKNGDEFWINLTVNPVADEKGWYTHWISIDRDITERKNRELQEALLADISLVFHDPRTLSVLLHQLLKKLIAYGSFMLAEVWLTDADESTVTMVAKDANNNKGQLFYGLSEEIKSFAIGEGLPGTVWATKKVALWDHLGENRDFLRREAAKISGLEMAYGIPLLADNLIIGVLVLGLDGSLKPSENLVNLFDVFSAHFGSEIKRKLTHHLLEESERKYSELFQLSPLPIWVFELETLRFLDVNKAATDHYGYSREEFLDMTIKDIRPIEEVPLLLTILNQHRSQPHFVVPGTVTHRKKNGELRLIEIQSNDIQYKGKNARIIMANDITDRVKYISAIETQNERLKEISWMQSHVTRAPLSRIMGLLPFLDEVNPNPADLKIVIDYIKISAIELDNVIHDINEKTIAVDYRA